MSLAGAKTSYIANSGYDINNSIVEAKAYLLACRQILLLLPSSSSDERTRTDLQPILIKGELDKVSAWLVGKGAMDDAASLVPTHDTVVDMSDFRSEWGGAA